MRYLLTQGVAFLLPLCGGVFGKPTTLIYLNLNIFEGKNIQTVIKILKFYNEIYYETYIKKVVPTRKAIISFGFFMVL